MLNIPTRDEIFLIQSGLTNYKSTKNTAQQVGWGVTRVKIITPLLPPHLTPGLRSTF